MVTFNKLKPVIWIFSLTTALLFAGSGCSSHQTSNSTSAQNSADAIAPIPDAGTDAVPQAAVEDRSGEASATGAAPPDPNAPPPAPIAENADGIAPPPAPIAEASPEPSIVAEAPPVATAPVPPAPIEAIVPPGMNNSGPTAAAAPAPTGADSNGNYVVRPGDTLMKIAFENYGDLYKWKDIYEANKDRISNPNAVPPGTQLQLDPSARVTVAHSGSQYMIKGGDTLGTISTDVYGTRRKWKRLWQNNKELIPDPNKIYAGFYLYYTLTPAEREDFKRRKGVEPEEPQTSPAPVAQQPEPIRNVSSVGQAIVAPQAVAPQAQQEEFLPPPVAANETQPAPQVQAQAAPVEPAQADAARAPAAMTPPTVVPVTAMKVEPAPQAPSLGIAPPPADHSADLNEVIQQAQKDEATASAPAAAGP